MQALFSVLGVLHFSLDQNCEIWRLLGKSICFYNAHYLEKEAKYNQKKEMRESKTQKSKLQWNTFLFLMFFKEKDENNLRYADICDLNGLAWLKFTLFGQFPYSRQTTKFSLVTFFGKKRQNA